jgi:S-formylglutathione hydrolase FrmB
MHRGAHAQPVSRRRFLTGAAGAMVLAAAGVAYEIERSPSGGDPPGRVGHSPAASGEPSVTNGVFRSKILGASVGYSLAVPAGHRLGDGLPVVFMLPGRGGTAAGCMTGTRMPTFVADAIRSGDAPPFALAAVDGGESYWHPRTSGEDRMSMLMQEFVPMCADRWRLGETRAGRAIMGWSMGGYGAILMAERYPQDFRAVAAASPAIWTSYDAMMLGPGDAFDSAAQFATYDVIVHADALAPTAVRVDCGLQDGFYPYVQAFVQSLPSPPAGVFIAGGHDGAFWLKIGPGQARFLGSQFAT